LTLPPKQIARQASILLALLATVFPPLQSQQPTPRTTILLDPAHGGPDPGAHLTDQLQEKTLTLAFATRLRAILATSGFAVISTRDADPTVPFTTDQRADIANHAHPTACLILHATSSGSGIHIITSTLSPPDDPDSPHAVIPWDTAQAASVTQSRQLANDLGLALLQAKLPVLLTRATLRPLDNFTCPAVAIEIAPLVLPDADPIPVTDTAYLQHIAEAIAQALTTWRARTAAVAAAAATSGAAR
jgi:N-acetylmuramoyl-L-alanine amidase